MVDDNSKKDNFDEEKAKIRGGKNLLILGIVSTVAAIATSAISIHIYHQSGDIYLDRSRPGFLFEDEEENKNDNKDDNDKNYSFSENGEINREELDEYLKNLQKITDKIEKLGTPYNEDPLTNESLGI